MSLIIIMVLFYAAMYDIKYCKIPNYIVLTIILLGMANSVFYASNTESSVSSITFSTLGLILALTICMILYISGVFGAGDAKLLASLGTIFGPINIIFIIGISVVFAGLLSLSRLSCYGELFPMVTRWYQSLKIGYYLKPESNTIASSAIPMGGAILLATVFCEFYIF